MFTKQKNKVNVLHVHALYNDHILRYKDTYFFLIGHSNLKVLSPNKYFKQTCIQTSTVFK